MNIADRIQQLRKSKGISQEELADKIGVSRQAVSKWESEQSSHDIEKIILMSDYFDVTTDYMLKGIEPIHDDVASKREKPDASIFAIAGTALDFMGIVVSTMVWYEEQVASATAIGIIFMIMGCMIYGIGMAVGDKATVAKAKRDFLALNVWTLTFIPLSIGYNILSGEPKFGAAPYPIPVGSHVRYLMFWVVYIAIGTVVNLIFHQKKK